MCAYKRPLTREDLPDTLSYQEDISILTTPLSIGLHTLPNRICYQPMEGCDGTHEGNPGELTVRRYRRFASGGAGLIWFEATAVVPEGRANPRQLWITRDNVDHFARLVDEIKALCLKENGYEPLVICQLTHSGRYSKPEGNPAPLIAYNKPVYEKANPIPSDRIVTDAYLDTLPDAYASSAALCARAGFDGVDIKACHGYLLSELLNAYLRPGKYGGNMEGRTHLLLEAVRAVQSIAPTDFILASRFNAYDGYPYPYGIGDSGTPGVPDLSEAVCISQLLCESGVRLLNITMGNPYTNHEVNRPTVQAEENPPYVSIKRMLDGAVAVQKANPQAAVVASGFSYLGSLAPQVAAAYMKAEGFTIAGFGRQNFAYPDLAHDLLQNGSMHKDKLCLTCGKCTELMRAGRTPGCVIYDKLYTNLYKDMKNEVQS
jgi:2,4-dienoyl-CoA reductase-like NADH-dependent reductase (Old Yellow Enzyme family)